MPGVLGLTAYPPNGYEKPVTKRYYTTHHQRMSIPFSSLPQKIAQDFPLLFGDDVDQLAGYDNLPLTMVLPFQNREWMMLSLFCQLQQLLFDLHPPEH